MQPYSAVLAKVIIHSCFQILSIARFMTQLSCQLNRIQQFLRKETLIVFHLIIVGLQEINLTSTLKFEEDFAGIASI